MKRFIEINGGLLRSHVDLTGVQAIHFNQADSIITFVTYGTEVSMYDFDDLYQTILESWMEIKASSTEKEPND